MNRVEFTPDVTYDPARHMTLAEVRHRMNVSQALGSTLWARGDWGWLPDPMYVQRSSMKTEIAFDRADAMTALATGAPPGHDGWQDVPGYVGVQLLWTGVSIGRVTVSALLPVVTPDRTAYLDGLERALRRMTGRWVAAEVLPTTVPGETVKVLRVPPFMWS